MMRTQQDKKKLSLYLTITEKALLDKLSDTWGLSNNQAVIKAIKQATNTPIDTFEAIPTPTPTQAVSVGLSKGEIELLIEQKIESLVNSRIDSLEVQEAALRKK